MGLAFGMFEKRPRSRPFDRRAFAERMGEIDRGERMMIKKFD